MSEDRDEALLRSVALQNASSILRARQRAERELVETQEALRRANAVLAAEKGVLQLIASGAALTEVLREIARGAEAQSGEGMLCSIQLLDEVTGRYTFGAAASLPPAFGPAIDGIEAGPEAQRAGMFDLDDPRWAAVRRFGDLRAGFSTPVRSSQGALLGTLTAFYRKAGTPGEKELAIAEHAARLASIALVRHRQEQELRSGAERLRASFEQAAVGIAIADLKGRFIEMNARFCEMLGRPRDRLLGMSFREVTHPEDLGETERHMRGLLDGSSDSYALEKRYVRPDGGVLWGFATVTLVRDQDGKPERFIGVIEDVGRRKQAEEALRDETRRLEVLNRTGTALASSLDLQAVLQTVTDAATEVVGARFGAFFYNVPDNAGGAYMLYTLSGAPREAFEKFGHPRATPLFGPTFRGEGVIRLDDVTRDPRYGQWDPHRGMPPGHLPVRSYLAVPVVSRSGSVIGGLFFGHPQAGVFTERAERLVSGIAAQAAIAVDNARLYEAAQRAAEERRELLESERHARAAAERASRMKDEFLATLSHELRTPLSSILGWSQVLRARKAGEDELRKGLETIERNARAQTQLIEDLLDMSRITSGKVRLDVQPILPYACVEQAIETVRHAAEAKGIRVERALDPSAGPISGDPNRLQQVVWNLLHNAIKFTPRGGKVQVVLERVNSHVEIGVADTGAGMEPDFVEHVFERFRQADSTTTRQYGGLGLGLAIVKHLVELHGGKVTAASDGLGKGSTFTVHLPLTAVHRDRGAAREHPRAHVEPKAADYAALDLSGVKILVVDDQEDARELVARVLRDCHAQVVSAANALEALEAIARERPDVLVSDIGMPDMDGYELVQRLRALPKSQGGAIPAIALTAFARSEDRTRALTRGFQVHVSKPVEPAELVATVASVLGRARS